MTAQKHSTAMGSLKLCTVSVQQNQRNLPGLVSTLNLLNMLLLMLKLTILLFAHYFNFTGYRPSFSLPLNSFSHCP